MKRFHCVPVLLLPALVAACSASKDSQFAASGGKSDASSGAGGTTFDVSVGVGSGGGSQGNCDSLTAICDGELAAPTLCDEGLNIDGDALSAAKALDLCHQAKNGGWGLVSAAYVRADGSPAQASKQTGLVSKFGDSIVPQAGKSMLVLSSGYARDAKAADGCGSETCKSSEMGVAPPGFPQDVPACPGSKDIKDDIGLEVKLKAPSNAKGYQFNFAFLSFEFAEWVCTDYNDQFVALVSPPPKGSIGGNISFDTKKNPVSVNLALFDHCDPASKATFGSNCQFLAFISGATCPPTPNPYCPAGAGFLKGTGMGAPAPGEWSDGGSTGWLITTAPVSGGAEFSIRFAIWDTGDDALDSTVLLDSFRWSADPVGIDTDVVPNPK